MGEGREAQTTVYKMGSRIYCVTWGIEPISYSNYKWKIPLKITLKLKKKNLRYNYLHLGEGNSNPLQDSCLENPMDRGAGQATVHGIERLDMT